MSKEKGRFKYYTREYNSMAHSLYNIFKRESKEYVGEGSINKLQEALQKTDRRVSEKNRRNEILGNLDFDTTALELYEMYKNGYLDKADYLDGIKGVLVQGNKYQMDKILEMRLKGFMKKYGDIEYEFNKKIQTLKEWEEDLDTGAISNCQFNDMIEDFKKSDLFEKENYERNRLM